ncbi:hypothetical protein CCHL11_09645 [Colletotrichum chlorophyti]|uniref:Integral membrane protein n=1 Tax=Colletotrichum chlorophyti TaxID=708187 RepID=A0A1Q8RFQ1_9PEZI|nr:hypothetical protein CCHL11_09645 [Colletotrichum chlorophyti]
MTAITDTDAVEVMPEIRATQNEPIASSRKVTVSINGDATYSHGIHISHGGFKDALTMQLHRTIRVPDNRDINSLPPSLGTFPLFKVRDYARRMPEDMAKKGGIFFPMYQREAMWISFSSSVPFAIKIYVGGVNAVSGFPMTENDKTREKRLRMLRAGKSIQDYMVVPKQPWLDGIASEDGNIRQFVAQPKGSGFSVEAQVTGEENVGGIQIEIIPSKKNVPTKIDFRYTNKADKVVTRAFDLAEKGLTAESTWLDVKKRIQDEFDIPVSEQLLEIPKSQAHAGVRSHFNPDFSDAVKLGDVYFPPNFRTIDVKHIVVTKVRSLKRLAQPRKGNPQGFMGSSVMALMSAAPSAARCSEAQPPAPPSVKEMGLAAGGLIKQTIETDDRLSDSWDVEASVMVNLQILDVESFCAVTGQPAPSTPVDAKTYADHGYPFFEIWGEEKTGIKGEFEEVKSVAQIEAERAMASGKDVKEEESVPELEGIGQSIGSISL